jgi:hypothetical protein
MVNLGKEPELVTAYQFGRLARVPGFSKVSSAFKPDVEICFKNMQRKYDCQSLDIHAFFDAIEVLSQKIYKNYSEEGVLEVSECLEMFLAEALPFFQAV